MRFIPPILACLALMAAGYAFWIAAAPPRDAAIGQPIYHDDFVFTVRRIQNWVVDQHTKRYDVALLVENKALRVNYVWRDSVAYVRDARGTTYRPVSVSEFVLPPGASRTAHIAFVLPGNVSAPALRFWDGILMGDALNGARYAHAAVPL